MPNSLRYSMVRNKRTNTTQIIFWNVLINTTVHINTCKA